VPISTLLDVNGLNVPFAAQVDDDEAAPVIVRLRVVVRPEAHDVDALLAFVVVQYEFRVE